MRSGRGVLVQMLMRRGYAHSGFVRWLKLKLSRSRTIPMLPPKRGRPRPLSRRPMLNWTPLRSICVSPTFQRRSPDGLGEPV